jgi:hypothetical protein
VKTAISPLQQPAEVGGITTAINYHQLESSGTDNRVNLQATTPTSALTATQATTVALETLATQATIASQATSEVWATLATKTTATTEATTIAREHLQRSNYSSTYREY